MLMCAVMIMSLDSDLDAVGLVCSVEDGLGGEAVRGVSDLWFVVCRLWRVGDEGGDKEGVVDRLFERKDFGVGVLERDPECRFALCNIV